MIISARDFDIAATLECGQVFRFNRLNDGGKFQIFSGDKRCILEQIDGNIHLDSDSEQYFFDYFDLGTDYGAIRNILSGFSELAPLNCGIRILRQDLFETIISFIISANNNIGRIKGIIERLCTNHGKKCDGYYAFPTLKQLENCDFEDIGAGYRAKYLAKTIKILANTSLLSEVKAADYDTAIKKLLTLSGIGRKVADCIALFALNHLNAYPVDTNIKKFDSGLKNIREHNQQRYGKYAGIAQQWKFYNIIHRS